MRIRTLLDKWCKLPTKAHKQDAGFDLYTPKDFALGKFDTAIIDTGVHMEIPEGYCGLVVAKSGLHFKWGITTTGLIDCGFTGSIKVRLTRADYIAENNQLACFSQGDKIAQIVLLPIADAELVRLLDGTFNASERGDNGFGSTGR